MDSQTDYSFDEQNVMLVPSVDPLVFNTFNAVRGSFDTTEQQFNTVNNSFASGDDTLLLLENPYNDDYPIISNDQMSSRTSFAAHEINYTTEDTTAHWSVDKLPLFPDLILLPDIVSVDEIDPLIPITDELQQASEPEEILMTNEVRNSAEPEQILVTEELQLSVEPEQILKTDEVRHSAEPEQILMTDKLQLSSEIEKLPTLEILTKPSKCQHTHMPHTYNTRMMAYKRSILEFIVQDQEMLDRVRKNQQRPTARAGSSTPHDQWIHSKNWVNINLLRMNIPLKKSTNYAQSRRYKKKGGRLKNAPVYSGSSNITCSKTTSKMDCAKEKSNQKHDSSGYYNQNMLKRKR